jgi:hypothetical protein
MTNTSDALVTTSTHLAIITGGSILSGYWDALT